MRPNLRKELPTPCLVLEADLLERNLRTMQALAARAGKHLRPHIKTHKCSALAKVQVAGGAIGLCAATIPEVERLVRAGVGGILLTGPLASAGRIRQLADCLGASPELIAVVESPETAAQYGAAAAARGRRLDVLIDVDVGLRRTGVALTEVPGLARCILGNPHLRLRGIQAYAGHLQHLPVQAQRAAESLRCLRAVVPVFRDLRAAVPTCDIFSASGTGTAGIDAGIPEVSELQAGSYACMDAEYDGIGMAEASRFAPALRVLTTVVSAQQPGFVTVDAGLKALYRDGGAPRILGPQAADLVYDWFGDEFGKVSAGAGAGLPRVGEVLEIQPAHCDPTINLFDRILVVDGDEVAAEWPIDLRGYG